MTEDKISTELPEDIVGALNYRRRGDESHGETLRRLLDETANEVSLSEYLTTLENHDVSFMAIPEADLARGVLWIVADAPRDAWDDIIEYVNDVQVVEVGDKTLLTEISRAHGENQVHTHRRVPVQVPDGIPGLDPVSIEDGADNVQEFVTEDREPTEAGSQTVSLPDLVDELVDVGAAAVTISEDLWRYSEELEFQVYLPASIGYDVCGDYGTVEVGERTFPVNFQFRQDGVGEHFETHVYLSDQWVGLDPVEKAEGLENARTLLTTTREETSARS
ncbi:hypothetical protein [Haloferax volcanii]|uniref:hypothetical protein n=1 Tax=Haloferax volcanii TaxID=2246 RepID=UPI003D302E33